MSDDTYGQNAFFNSEPAWHKKGTVGNGKIGAVGVFNGMPEQVRFELRPFSIQLNGQAFVGKDTGIIRISGVSEELVGRTKNRYKLTQPIDYCQMFDSHVRQPVETMGFLGTNGSRMFLTWNLPDLDVHGDKVRNFGFIAVGFDGLFGEKLYLTNIRVVCNNTWQAAINSSEAVYSGKHSHLNHERDMALWMEHVQKQAEERVTIHENLFRKWEETKITKEQARKIFESVYPTKSGKLEDAPAILIEEEKENVIKFNLKQIEKRDLATELFGGRGIAITPTVWGAFNCVTEQENHHIPSKKDALNSLLLGSRAEVMSYAMSVCEQYSKFN